MEIQSDISKNREMFERVFNCPVNKDIVFRDFKFSGRDGFITYIDGMSDSEKISDFILRPLLNSVVGAESISARSDDLKSVLQTSFVSQESDFQSAASAVLQGDAVLCLDGDDKCYICETKGFDKRGPQDR